MDGGIWTGCIPGVTGGSELGGFGIRGVGRRGG